MHSYITYIANARNTVRATRRKSRRGSAWLAESRLGPLCGLGAKHTYTAAAKPPHDGIHALSNTTRR